ncbi:MAG: cytochrome c [Steroidobacteraceae bacterium]
MKFQSLLLPVLIACAVTPAWAEGSAEAGQAKTAVCVACHGVDGNSANPEWPSLAGQSAPFIVKQLQAFKSDARQNPLMTPQAKMLSDQDIQDLAAYYSKQARRGGEADSSKVALGQRIYRGGDKARGVPACLACHGPNGGGNGPAGYAAIGGQHATYLAAQLRAYKTGTRQTDPNQMMRNVASALSDEQIDAVASYVQGLR